MSEVGNTELGYKTEVGKIEEPMLRLCDRLKPLLEDGRYSLIVGEDVSGRLPALIVKGFSDEVASRSGQEKLPIVFVTNKRSPFTPLAHTIAQTEIEERVLPVLSKVEGKSNRVLIVTDFIGGGETINRLINDFNQRNIPTDIAVLRRREQQIFPIMLPEGSLLIEGENATYPPLLTGRYDLIGFEISDSYEGGEGPLKRHPDRAKATQAREDVGFMVQKAVARAYPEVEDLSKAA